MKPFVLMAAALFLTAACDELVDNSNRRLASGLPVVPGPAPGPVPGPTPPQNGPPAGPPGEVATFISVSNLPNTGEVWADGMATISVMFIDPNTKTVSSFSPVENVYGRVVWNRTDDAVTYNAGDASVELAALWKYNDRTYPRDKVAAQPWRWREDWFGPIEESVRDYGFGATDAVRRSFIESFNGRFDIYFNPEDKSYVIFPVEGDDRAKLKLREYHKFGSWAMNNDDGTTTFGNTVAGAATTAAELANARAALTGTAVYNGTSHGVAVRNGQRKWIHSLITLTTDDFETVRINSGDVKSFDETDPKGTKGGVEVTGSVTAENVDPTLAELEFSGDLTVLDDGSFFAGDIANDGGDFTGTAQGNFYGPNADEAGGTFSGGYDDTTYFGSFGTVRNPASD